MAKKPKIAIYGLGACGGCDEAIIDLNEALLEIASAVEIVLWPLAMDHKYDSIRALPDKSIALSIIHGNIRNSENEEMAHLLRAKSEKILAFGSCSCFGGTPGLANFFTRDEIFRWVYSEAPTVENREGAQPQPSTSTKLGELKLPEFLEHLYALNQVIPVDYFLPGCPPPPDLIGNAVSAVLEGKLPPTGAFLAPQKSLCDSCARNRTKPPRIDITRVKRVHEVEVDSHTCFLVEGVLCLGPATRNGCGETCIRANTPCRGCFGPVEGVEDAGAKFLSAFASLLKANTDEQVQEIMERVCDPAGSLYRFTQPISILGKQNKLR